MKRIFDLQFLQPVKKNFKNLQTDIMIDLQPPLRRRKICRSVKHL